MAKDIAGMLNASGGTILVGISEKDGVAAGFVPNDSWPKDPSQWVLQALKKHLSPSSCVDHVRTKPQRVVVDGTDRMVLVVEIDPWPRGPVAHSPVPQLSYQFPVRRGAHTDFISLENAMVDLDRAHRSMWLRLREFQRGQREIWVAFQSPILAPIEGRLQHAPLFEPGTLGTLQSVEPDHIMIAFRRSNYFAWLSSGVSLAKVLGGKPSVDDFEADPFGASIRAFASHAEPKLQWDNLNSVTARPIPLALVRAAWMQEHHGYKPVLHLMLDANLHFQNGDWSLRSG